MRLYISIISFIILIAAIAVFYFKTLSGEDVSIKTYLADYPTQVRYDTMPRITGIGGIFFHSEDPAKTNEWYKLHLGLKTDAYGAVFEFRNALNPNNINYSRWSPTNDPEMYGSTGNGKFMINYRVQNLAGMIRNMKLAGISINDTISEYPYGKFIHLTDIDGRKIELWEPLDSVLTQMNGITNK